jgi:RimJ/RimL family protein N-acetyltransferase
VDPWGGGGATLLGQVGIYPRDATKRVLIGDADRAEIGYWLSTAATGRGFATEAAQQMVEGDEESVVWEMLL